MKKLVLLILSLFLAVLPLRAQFYSAGPDKTICSGTGAYLGTNVTIPSGWCIHWTPEAGLDDPTSARPLANPKQTTVYTVTVLTESWHQISTDDVKVTVGFGGIKFQPPYLNQGSDETSHATVTINPGNVPVEWSIQGDALGCTINSMTGDITPGDQYGKITVRATNQEDQDCYADETIEINEGARDITARDATHPGRIAREGKDTLYIVGESSAIITAIPNETGFSPGSPVWYDDGDPNTLTLPPGTTTYTDNLSLSGEHHFIAGSEPGYNPKVIVIALNSDEFQIDVSPIVSLITSKIEEINNKIKAKIAKKFPSVPNLNVEVNLASLKYKKSKVEKYNDPGWANKYVFEAGGSLALSGRIYHPQFTQIFDISVIGIYAGTELYLEPYFEASLVGMVQKDPSKEDPGWTFINPVKANLTGGIRGVFNVVGTATGYSIEGGFSLNAEVGIDFTFNPLNGELRIKITVAPLQGITKVLIERYVDPKRKWTFFNYTVDLMDKWTSPDYLIFDFGAQN